MKTQQLFRAPKTTVSRRSSSLPPELVTELLALCHKQETQKRLLGDRYTDHGLVFCQANGKPLHAHNIARRDLRRVLALDELRSDLKAKGVAEEALPKELPRIRFHDLRHCHATLLLQQGVHPKVVQGDGHSTISMTLDTYSHVVPGMQEPSSSQRRRTCFHR